MRLRPWVCKGEHNPVRFATLHDTEINDGKVVYICRVCGGRTEVVMGITASRNKAENKARKKYFASNELGGVR